MLVTDGYIRRRGWGYASFDGASVTFEREDVGKKETIIIRSDEDRSELGRFTSSRFITVNSPSKLVMSDGREYCLRQLKGRNNEYSLHDINDREVVRTTYQRNAWSYNITSELSDYSERGSDQMLLASACLLQIISHTDLHMYG